MSVSHISPFFNNALLLLRKKNPLIGFCRKSKSRICHGKMIVEEKYYALLEDRHKEDDNALRED